MTNTIYAALMLLLLTLISSNSYAQSRCDCLKPEGECIANLNISQNNWVIIESNTNVCSQVIWYVGVIPQITIVTDGISRKKWSSLIKPKNVYIESCNVCIDHSIKASSSSGGIGGTGFGD